MINENIFEKNSFLCEKKNIRSKVGNALINNEFQVYYQPQYDCEVMNCCSVEALVRWQQPEEGLISPAVFIPKFEKNDCIYELDKSVWEKACCDFAEWRELGIAPGHLSLNISRIDILKEDIEEVLAKILKKYALKPNMIHLEITETACVDGIESMSEVIQSLQSKGFVIEMDDFGTGYSSLKLLKHIPFDVVKLDMGFLYGCETDRKAKNILTSIIDMLKKDRITIIMEGVETKEQVLLLKKFGCNFMQGYYFGKPMPKEELQTLLESMAR